METFTPSHLYSSDAWDLIDAPPSSPSPPSQDPLTRPGETEESTGRMYLLEESLKRAWKCIKDLEERLAILELQTVSTATVATPSFPLPSNERTSRPSPPACTGRRQPPPPPPKSNDFLANKWNKTVIPPVSRMGTDCPRSGLLDEIKKAGEDKGWLEEAQSRDRSEPYYVGRVME